MPAWNIYLGLFDFEVFEGDIMKNWQALALKKQKQLKDYDGDQTTLKKRLQIGERDVE